MKAFLLTVLLLAWVFSLLFLCWLLFHLFSLLNFLVAWHNYAQFIAKCYQHVICCSLSVSVFRCVVLSFGDLKKSEQFHSVDDGITVASHHRVERKARSKQQKKLQQQQHQERTAKWRRSKKTTTAQKSTHSSRHFNEWNVVCVRMFIEFNFSHFVYVLQCGLCTRSKSPSLSLCVKMCFFIHSNRIEYLFRSFDVNSTHNLAARPNVLMHQHAVE